MRKFFAVVLLLIFWISVFFSLSLITIRLSVFNPDYLKNALTESNFYSQAPELVIDEYLDQEIIDQEIVRQILTPEWLEKNLIVIIDAAYSQFFIDSNFSDLENFHIDISGLNHILPTEEIDLEISEEVDLLTVINLFALPEDVQMQLEVIKNTRSIVVFFTYFFLTLSFLSLLGIILLFLFKRPSLLAWLSVSTVPPGLATFSIAGVLKMYLSSNKFNFLEKVYSDLLIAYLNPILNSFIIFGLIFLILGILFLVLKKVIHKPAQ